MEVLRSKYVLILGLFIAAYLPFSLLTVSSTSNWWINYISWVGFFMQSFLMITAGLLIFRAAFHKKVLGGLIGTGLRIFSIGLLILGIGLTQIPFVQAYNFWNTPYVTTGFYFVPYLVGVLCVFFSLLIGRLDSIVQLLSISGAVGMFGIFFRLVLGKVPLLPHTYFTTMQTYQQGLTTDTILFCLISVVILFSFFHQQTSSNTQIKHLYQLQTLAFVWYLVPSLSDFLIETVPGWERWYTYSLGGNILFAGSLLLAAISFYRIGLYVDKLRI
jgi:hypothetical protein